MWFSLHIYNFLVKQDSRITLNRFVESETTLISYEMRAELSPQKRRVGNILDEWVAYTHQKMFICYSVRVDFNSDQQSLLWIPSPLAVPSLTTGTPKLHSSRNLILATAPLSLTLILPIKIGNGVHNRNSFQRPASSSFYLSLDLFLLLLVLSQWRSFTFSSSELWPLYLDSVTLLALSSNLSLSLCEPPFQSWSYFCPILRIYITSTLLIKLAAWSHPWWFFLPRLSDFLSSLLSLFFFKFFY